MDNQKESFPQAGREGRPIDDTTGVIRNVLRSLELNFDEEDGALQTRVISKTLEFDLRCAGWRDDVAKVAVRLPVRASPENMARVGEFLHRRNFGAKRKIWELDHNDGEIRAAIYIDTVLGPLEAGIFPSVLQFIFGSVEATFPYLTSVLSGRMSAEFAADQADAATADFWKNLEGKGE